MIKNKTISCTIIFLLILTVMPGCRDKNKPSRDMFIPENTLIDILTDTYLAQGIMDVQSVRQIYRYRDSLTNINDILRQYGCNNQQLDSTLKYYFLYKPGRLEAIYDKVTGKLLDIEAVVTKEGSKPEPVETKNYWPEKTTYIFPDDFLTDSIAFSIPITEPGNYRFSAYYLLFHDDESIDPMVSIYYRQILPDGTDIRSEWDQKKLKKDGKSNLVSIEKFTDIKGDTFIEGYLFRHSNIAGNWRKHARIMGIIIERNPASSYEKE